MGTRFACRKCGTTITAPSLKEAVKFWCKCGKRYYAAAEVSVPVLPVDPEHEALVDRLVAQATGHGGAREGAGRPRLLKKADHIVSFRLTAAEFKERTKAAKNAGYDTVHAWAKALLLRSR